MFRFIRPIAPLRPSRSIFSMSRLPLRLESQVQRGQVINIQKVRLKKAPWRFRSFAITLLTIYVGFSVYNRLVFDPLDAAVGEAVKNIPEQELDEDDYKPLFIPFPGTTKQLKPHPYRASDPEWQAFLKFSKDPALSKSIRDELAEFVRSLAEKHPVLRLRCGTGMKLRRYWLDVNFPEAPPPEFERSGIEITDDYIAWTTIPVDSLVVYRIRQALWPSALAKSFWSFTKVLVADDLKRAAQLLGIQTASPPPSFEQIIAKHQQLIKGPSPPKDGPAKQPQPLGDATKAIATINQPGREKTGLTGKGSEEDEIGPGARTGMALHAHFFRAIMAFKIKLQQTWKPAPDWPPRGSILISGLVEIDTPKCWLVFDVKAAWDPKTMAYDPRSMQLALRRMQMKKQPPPGGL